MNDRICPACGDPLSGEDRVCPHCGAVFPDPGEVLTTGTILKERYEVQQLLHSGGMSYVYLVKDKSLFDRLCILKEVSERIRSQSHLEKLEGEAMRMAKLSHPGVAVIFDHFVEKDRYFLVVEYIRGKTLSEVLRDRNGRIRQDEVVRWAISICDVVRFMHDQGVIHRDISPDNIMLTSDGSIKFIDFGTLKEFRSIAAGKTAGMGKYGFTPPEQWQGKPVPQSDIFALGATVYQLLTGFLPLSKSVLTGRGPREGDFAPKFPPIRSLNPEVSLMLESVLEKALELEPPRRYATAIDLRDDLVRLYKETPDSQYQSQTTVSLPSRENPAFRSSSKPEAKRRFAVAKTKRKRILNTLQRPAILLPLGACALSGAYMLLLAPIYGGYVAAVAVLAASGITASVAYWRQY